MNDNNADNLLKINIIFTGDKDTNAFEDVNEYNCNNSRHSYDSLRL